MVGGIGVFFPGPNGYASYEQGFVPGVPQTQAQRLNTHLELEAEYMAFAAVGGSSGANASIGTINGVAPVAGLDLPFGRVNLGGISLPLYGPGSGADSVQELVSFGKTLGVSTPDQTEDQIVAPGEFYQAGVATPSGWLVTPHSSSVPGSPTTAEVTQIIDQGIATADLVQSAIRVPLGSTAEMDFAVTDSTGNILGLYRMPDSTYFSVAVAVAKARNVSYYDDPSQIPAGRRGRRAGSRLHKPNVSFPRRTAIPVRCRRLNATAFFDPQRPRDQP